MSATEITILYRDAGNYNFRSQIIVAGHIDKLKFEEHLIDGIYFVPEKIGLPNLRPTPANEDDHALHEFEAFEKTDKAPEIESAELIARIKSASENGWFYG